MPTRGGAVRTPAESTHPEGGGSKNCPGSSPGAVDVTGQLARSAVRLRRRRIAGRGLQDAPETVFRLPKAAAMPLPSGLPREADWQGGSPSNLPILLSMPGRAPWHPGRFAEGCGSEHALPRRTSTRAGAVKSEPLRFSAAEQAGRRRIPGDGRRVRVKSRLHGWVRGRSPPVKPEIGRTFLAAWGNRVPPNSALVGLKALWAQGQGSPGAQSAAPPASAGSGGGAAAKRQPC